MINLTPASPSDSLKAHYYESVYVVLTHPEKYIGRRFSIGGNVVGDTIQFDGHFVIFKIKDACTAPLPPDDDPDHGCITIVLVNGSKPTLLQDGVKAIAAGTMRPDGIFCADDLALVTAYTHL